MASVKSPNLTSRKTLHAIALVIAMDGAVNIGWRIGPTKGSRSMIAVVILAMTVILSVSEHGFAL